MARPMGPAASGVRLGSRSSLLSRSGVVHAGALAACVACFCLFLAASGGFICARHARQSPAPVMSPSPAVQPPSRPAAATSARPPLELPVEPPAAAAHQSFSVLTSVWSKERVVALTLDLGETATRSTVTRVLELLDARHQSCTWFVTGWFIRTCPDLLERMQARGDQFGNHTDTHPHCRRLSAAKLTHELETVERLLEQKGMAIAEPRYWRPPFGEYDDGVVATARARGYRTVIWSATSLDYDSHSSGDRCAHRILSEVAPGGIILAHATSASCGSLPIVLDTLAERGYRVTTLQGLVEAAEAEGR